MGKSIRVSNGKETFEINDTDLQSAVNDGFLPTERVIVANSKTKEIFEIDPADLPNALKDGFSFSDIKPEAVNLPPVPKDAYDFNKVLQPVSNTAAVLPQPKTIAGVNDTNEVQDYEATQKEYVTTQKKIAEVDKGDYGFLVPNILIDAERELMDDINPNRKFAREEKKKQLEQQETIQEQQKIKAVKAMRPRVDAVVQEATSKVDQFVKSSFEGFSIPDPIKIDAYAKEQAKKYGVGEEGYFKTLVYNEVHAAVQSKIVEPLVDKKFHDIYLKANGKPVEDDLAADFNKGFVKGEQIKGTATAQADLVFKTIQTDTKSKADQLHEAALQKTNPITDALKSTEAAIDSQFGSLIKDGKFVGSAEQFQQYQSAIENYKTQAESSQSSLQELNKQFLNELNIINTKNTAQYRRQIKEISIGADAKLKAAATEYENSYLRDPAIQKKVEAAYKQAYTEVMKGREDAKGIRSNFDPAIINLFKTYTSAFGSSLKNISTTFNFPSGKLLGEYLESEFQVGNTSLKKFVDLFDAQKFAKTTGQLFGGMTPSIIASVGTVAATRGSGASTALQLLASGAAGWAAETVDIVGGMYNDKFAETGDASKAKNAANQSLQSQILLAPTYALEGLPFMGKAIKLGKNALTRALLGGTVEFITEMTQEYPQNLFEEAIKNDGTLATAFNYHSAQKLKETALNIAPVFLLGAYGQAKESLLEKDNKLDTIKASAKAFAQKISFAKFAPGQREQFLFDMMQRQGENFTSAYLLSSFTSGQIDKATFNEMSKALTTSADILNKSKDLNLSPAEQKIFTAFTFQYDKAKRAFDNETDPLLKKAAEGIMKGYEAQVTNFASKKQADYSVLTYANNEQYVYTHAEMENALNDYEFSKAVSNGEMKVEVFGNGEQLKTKVQSLLDLTPKQKAALDLQAQMKAELEGMDFSDNEEGDKTVEQLRADEQKEYEAIDPNDEVKKKEIYDRYDKLITPLLEKEKQAKPTEDFDSLKEGDEVNFISQSREELIGKKVIIPGFEDFDTVMVTDGLSKDIYSLAIGKRIGNAKVGSAFSEKDALREAAELLTKKNMSASKIHSWIHTDEKDKFNANPNRNIVRNESPAYNRYKAQQEAIYNNLPFFHDEAARQKFIEQKAVAEKEGFTSLAKDIDFEINKRKVPSQNKYNLKGLNNEYFEKRISDAKEKRNLNQLKDEGKPYPKDKIEILDGSFKSFKEYIQYNYKKEQFDKLPKEMQQKAAEAFAKEIAIRNKYGYTPATNNDGIVMAVLHYIVATNSKSSTEERVAAAEKKVYEVIKAVDERAKKEGIVIEDNQQKTWKSPDGEIHPIVEVGDKVKYEGKDYIVTLGNNPDRWDNDFLRGDNVPYFRGKPVGEKQDGLLHTNRLDGFDELQNENEEVGLKSVPTAQVEKPMKVLKKRKKPSQHKDPIVIAALDIDPVSPDIIVAQHFINGGTIGSIAIQELFGGKKMVGKKKIKGEMTKRISYIRKDGLGIDGLGDKLWDGASEEVQNMYDSQDFSNAVEQYVRDFTHRKQMAEDLVNRYGNEKTDDAKEAAYWENYYGPADQAIEDLTPEQFEILTDENNAEGVDFQEEIEQLEADKEALENVDLTAEEKAIANEQINDEIALQIINDNKLTLDNLEQNKDRLFKGFPYEPQDYIVVKKLLSNDRSNNKESAANEQQGVGDANNQEASVDGKNEGNAGTNAENNRSGKDQVPSDQEIKALEKSVADAKKELSIAEEKLAAQQGKQADLFAGGVQKEMFVADGSEAKSILDPLKRNLKEAEAALEKAKNREVKDERQGFFDLENTPKEKKKLERKVRDEKLLKELDDLMDDFLKPDGNLTMGGISPEKIEKGTKLIAKYLKLGIYKFSDIIEDMYARIGDNLKEYFDALKSAYSTYYNTEATDEEAEKMDANIRQYTFENVAKKLDDVYNRPGSSQQDSGNAGNVVPSNEENVSGNGITSAENGKGTAEANSKNSGRPSGSVSGSLFADPVRESGNNELYKPIRGTQPSQYDAGVTDGRGNSVDGTNGVYAGRPASDGSNQSTEATTGSFKERIKIKLAEQKAAESIPVKTMDRANIAETLPFLLPEQQDDVLKAETRFLSAENKTPERANGKGMLFTNGTGTGKTYTGLGIIKRMVQQGKKNILIVVPSQEKVKDWSNDGRNLGLNIVPIEDTKDGGKELNVTTYANFRANEELLKRDFDLVVYDESHRLMESKSGSASSTTETHYKISNKNTNTAFERISSVHPTWKAYRAAMARYSELNKSLNNGQSANPEQDEKEVKQLSLQIDKLAADIKLLTPSFTERAKTAAANTKVLFLSATPFKTHFNLRYANGFLFDWGDRTTYVQASRGESRVDAESQFYLDNFGGAYEWKFHRLQTKEGGNPDAIAMQEVQFSERMMANGSISGRTINSEQDYSREFPLVTGFNSTDFNKAFNDIFDFNTQEFEGLRESARSVFYNYNYTTQLFESLKTAMSIDRIKKHLDLGRKVVIFHRRQQANTEPPFQRILNLAGEDAALKLKDPNLRQEDKERAMKTLGQIAAFEEKYQSLLSYEQTLNYSSAVDQIQAAFGSKAVFFNGNVAQKAKSQAIKDFNTDGSGKDILLVQEEAGKEGISLHDTSSKHQRVLINLSMPISTITALQVEGRIYRIGQESDAIFEYPLLGLDLEIAYFGQNINKRLSTTENLAVGSAARDLTRSFAEGVLFNSNTNDPSNEQGKGGKEYDRKADNAQSEFEKAKLIYSTNQKIRGRRDQRSGVDYFATPEPLGQKMVEWASLQQGDSALEPSAGHGAIAMWVPNSVSLTAVEPSFELYSKLSGRAGGSSKKVLNQPFEDLNIINKFDGIVMNPPFGVGGKMAMDHLEKAFKHLHDGGRIVALLPQGGAMEKRLQDFLYGKDDKGNPKNPSAHLRKTFELPSITFQQAGTSVNSEVVIIDKVTKLTDENKQDLANDRSQVGNDLSLKVDEIIRTFQPNSTKVEANTINELFDAIEYISAPKKLTVEKAQQQVIPENKKSSSDKIKISPVKEYVNTRTGDILYIAKPAIYLGNEYKAINEAAKKHNGYYSSFAAAKGFLFANKSDAEQFVNEINGVEDKPLFSPKSSIKVEKPSNVPASVQNMRKAFPDAVVVQNQSDLPQTIQDEAAKQGIAVEGVYFEGKVYLVAENMDDMGRAEAVYRHEKIGHQGVIAHFKNNISSFANSLVDGATKAQLDRVNAIAQKMFGKNADELTIAQKSIIGQEYIAQMAENPTESPKTWAKVVAWVRETLRSLGIDLSVTDNEIKVLLAKVAQNQQAAFKQTKGEVLFMNVNGEMTKVVTMPDVVNGFYSPLEKVIRNTKFDKLPAKQWLEKFAVGEEAKWTGLSDWLSTQEGSVSKADIQKFLKDNRIQVVEVVNGTKPKLTVSKSSNGSYYAINAATMEPVSEAFKTEQAANDYIAKQSMPKEQKLEAIRTEFNDNSLGYYLTKDMAGDIVVEDKDGEYLEGVLPNERLQQLVDQYYELNESDESYDTKYGDRPYLQVEGEKGNYKEVLVTLPSKSPTSKAELQKKLDSLDDKQQIEINKYRDNLGLSKTNKKQYFFVTDENGQVVFLGENREERDEWYNKNDNGDYDKVTQYAPEGINTKEEYENWFNPTSNLLTAIEAEIKQVEDELSNPQAEEGAKFKSSHFDEPNILVHLRMNTRTDAKGNIVLFLEEVQSDWGQKGKREGFDSKQLEKRRNELLEESYQIERKENDNIITKKVANTGNFSDFEISYKDEKIKNELAKRKSNIQNEINEINKKTGIIPTAPFVMDTNAWTKLGLKVALKEAVKQGADKIAWTTGEQQNDRYDLSKIVEYVSTDITPMGRYINISPSNGMITVQVDDNGIINYQSGSKSYGDFIGKPLSDIIGKDVSERILKSPNGTRLEGDGLKVGGKGMIGFYGSPSKPVIYAKPVFVEGEGWAVETLKNKYDLLGGISLMTYPTKELAQVQADKLSESIAQKIAIKDGFKENLGIVGNVAKSLFKQEPKTVTINSDKESRDRAIKTAEDNDMLSDEQRAKLISDLKSSKGNATTQHSIDITPELKAQVEQGLPLFSGKAVNQLAKEAAHFIKEMQAKGKTMAEMVDAATDYMEENWDDKWEPFDRDSWRDLFVAGINKKNAQIKATEGKLTPAQITIARAKYAAAIRKEENKKPNIFSKTWQFFRNISFYIDNPNRYITKLQQSIEKAYDIRTKFVIPLGRMFEQNANGQGYYRVREFLNAVTDGLNKKQLENFKEYLFAMRTKDRLTQSIHNNAFGIEAANRATGNITLTDANGLLESLEQKIGAEAFADFEKRGANMQRLMDQMLNRLVESGVLSQEAYDEIKMQNDFYAPFNVLQKIARYDDGTGVAVPSNIIKNIKGIKAVDGVYSLEDLNKLQDASNEDLLDANGQIQKNADGTNKKVITKDDFYKASALLLDDLLDRGIITDKQYIEEMAKMGDSGFEISDILDKTANIIFDSYRKAHRNELMKRLGGLAKLDTEGIVMQSVNGFELRYDKDGKASSVPKRLSDIKVPEGFGVIGYRVAGKQKFLAIELKAANTINGLDKVTLPGWMKAVNFMNVIFRTAVITLSLPFQVSNFIIDTYRSLMFSRYGLLAGKSMTDRIANLVLLVPQYMNAFMVSGAANIADKHTELFKEFMKSGAYSEGQFDDPFTSQKLLKVGKKSFFQHIKFGGLDKVFKLFEGVGRTFEQTQKIVMFERGMDIDAGIRMGVSRWKNIISEAKTPDDMATALDQIAYEIQNSAGSPNFPATHGLMKVIGVIFQFFSARVKGEMSDSRRIAAMFGANTEGVKMTASERTQMLVQFAAMATPIIYMALKNIDDDDDEEEYLTLSPYDRLNNMIFPTGTFDYEDDDGNVTTHREMVKVPLRGITSTINSLAVDFARYAKSKDPALLKHALVQLAGNLSPLNINNTDYLGESIFSNLTWIPKAALEITNNRNYFLHEDLIPDRFNMKGVGMTMKKAKEKGIIEPYYVFTKRTPDWAIEWSKGIYESSGISITPVALDYMHRNVFGNIVNKLDLKSVKGRILRSESNTPVWQNR